MGQIENQHTMPSRMKMMAAINLRLVSMECTLFIRCTGDKNPGVVPFIPFSF